MRSLVFALMWAEGHDIVVAVLGPIQGLLTALVFGTSPNVLHANGFHIESSMGESMPAEVQRRVEAAERLRRGRSHANGTEHKTQSGNHANTVSPTPAAVTLRGHIAGSTPQAQLMGVYERDGEVNGFPCYVAHHLAWGKEAALYRSNNPVSIDR